MSVGTISMACLMLVAGQVTDDWDFLNQRNLKIPVQIEAARRADLRELLLFRSADQGKSWQQIGKIAPDKDGFNYYGDGDGDGEFWFQIATVSQQGKQDPEGLDLVKRKPSRKIV